MLNDTEKEKVTQTQEKEKMDGRRENIHLAKIGVMVFITFVCCILFFFSKEFLFLNRFINFTSLSRFSGC